MITPVEYQLTKSELHIASIVGLQRALSAVWSERGGRYGAETGMAFDTDVIGSVGEMTLAKHLNHYWNGAFGEFTASDVGKQFQVRASSYTGPNAGLILHPADADDQPFVKVIVRLPKVLLMGWLMGSEGKQQRYWCEPRKNRPCFLIPHELLHPMTDLLV